MGHMFIGAIVLALALTIICAGIITGPVLKYVRIVRSARWAFSICCITLGAYLASVSKLFFRDELSHVNYSPELIAVRIIALVAAVWFLVNIAICSHKIAKHEGRRSFFVREDYPRKRKW